MPTLAHVCWQSWITQMCQSPSVSLILPVSTQISAEKGPKGIFYTYVHRFATHTEGECISPSDPMRWVWYGSNGPLDKTAETAEWPLSTSESHGNGVTVEQLTSLHRAPQTHDHLQGKERKQLSTCTPKNACWCRQKREEVLSEFCALYFTDCIASSYAWIKAMMWHVQNIELFHQCLLLKPLPPSFKWVPMPLLSNLWFFIHHLILMTCDLCLRQPSEALVVDSIIIWKKTELCFNTVTLCSASVCFLGHKFCNYSVMQNFQKNRHFACLFMFWPAFTDPYSTSKHFGVLDLPVFSVIYINIRAEL